MARFLIKRLGAALAALVAVAAIVFVVQVYFLYRVLHLSPAAAIVYPHDTAQAIAQVNRALGLNLPLPAQFFLWAKATISGAAGQIIVHSLPPTMELLGLGAALAFVLALILAMLQLRFRGGVVDYLIEGLSSLLSVVPGFWLGTLLVFVFAMEHSWFPATGFPLAGQGFASWLYHEIMPCSTLALTAVGPWTRVLRGSLEDSYHADYVRTARAKGASEGRIRHRHILRNSVLPLVTLIGLSLPSLLNTVIVLEIIFNVPGAGTAFYNALTGLFYANATTIALVLAMVTVLGNVLVDGAYGLIDPRISYR